MADWIIILIMPLIETIIINLKKTGFVPVFIPILFWH